MTANAIEAVALSKRFTVPTERRTSFKERFVRGRAPRPKAFWALRDATFAVPKGSSLGLIGHNGSGKSTALKVLTGIYRPSSGQVTVNGSVSALLEVGAGFHPELTGRENIRLNATILGFTSREIDRLMDSIIEFADIGEHIDAPIKHYSSGMYVRLGFAIAVMVRPEILLIDEVIAVGDEEFQRRCYEYLYDLRRAGTSMIIVSHGLGQITDLCDDAVWLEHGRIRGIGPSRRVVGDYLDAVNSKEAQRASADSLQAAPDGQPRRGTGELRFTAVEFLDDQGSSEELLVTGRPCSIRLHFEASHPCTGVRIDLAIRDQSRATVTGSTSQDRGTWSVPDGRGHIDFSMDPLLIAPGTYEVVVEAFAEGHLVDALEHGVPMVVRESGTIAPGLFLQRGSWQLVTSAPAGIEQQGSLLLEPSAVRLNDSDAGHR